MPHNKERRGARPARAAIDSALVVLMMAAIACVVVICLAIIWLVITEWQRIAWAITMGGDFWGGFTVSVLGLFAGAWAIDTAAQLDEDTYSRAIFWLKMGGIWGIGISVGAQISLVGFWLNGEFGKLAIHQVLALGFPIGCSVMYLLYNAYTASLERD